MNARGLVSPGKSAEKTVYLAPGLYAVDCWVKTEDGISHISAGITGPLTITEESANSPEPSVDNYITLRENEINVQWNAETGPILLPYGWKQTLREIRFLIIFIWSG